MIKSLIVKPFKMAFNRHERKGDVVHEYCNGGPVSLNLIEPNLYLSNLTAATDVPTLTKYGINYILTIDSCPLPRRILEIKNLCSKFIQLSDVPSEDLLRHFEDTYAFIEEGVQKGAVLVHCYFGVSRSATVVIAYLMKKYNLSYLEAFEKTKTKRPLVYPNHGFVSQLKLYREMGYVVNRTYMKYKKFRMSQAANIVRKIKRLPQDYFDLIKTDPGLAQIQPEPNGYRCKRCRRVLASESSLITHQDKNNPSTYCTKAYFIEPLSWMKDITHCTEGKLYCPKCNFKVGSFTWIMGCHCPCGSQIAPAFYLTPSKVDWSNVVKNVEVTI